MQVHNFYTITKYSNSNDSIIKFKRKSNGSYNTQKTNTKLENLKIGSRQAAMGSKTLKWF